MGAYSGVISTARQTSPDTRFQLDSKLQAADLVEFELLLRSRLDRAQYLDVARAVLKTTSNVSVAVGQDIVHQGGFARRNESFYSPIQNPFLEAHLPFLYSQAVVEFDYSDVLSVQWIDDVTTKSESTGVFTNRNQQPAAVVQILMPFSRFQFLAQGAYYDLNKSGFFGLGLSWTFNQVSGYFDWIQDFRRQKYLSTESAFTPFAKYDYQDLFLEFSILARTRTFICASHFELRQARVSELGVYDYGANKRKNSFNDNAFVLGGGINQSILESKEVWLQAAYFEVHGKYYKDENQNRISRSVAPFFLFGLAIQKDLKIIRTAL